MDAGEAIRRFPQGGWRDDHKVNLGQRMDIRVLHGANRHGDVEARTRARPKPPDRVVGHPKGQGAVQHVVRNGAWHLGVGHVPTRWTDCAPDTAHSTIRPGAASEARTNSC